MNNRILASAVAGSLLAFAGVAHADSRTADINVTASVGKNCIITATDIDFGVYTGVTGLTANSDVTLRCTRGTAYTLKLSAGGSGDYNARELTDGTDVLGYNLFSNAARTTVWGDGGTDVVTGTGQGMAFGSRELFTVYGDLPNTTANQDVPAGTYDDLVVLTVEY